MRPHIRNIFLFVSPFSRSLIHCKSTGGQSQQKIEQKQADIINARCLTNKSFLRDLWRMKTFLSLLLTMSVASTVCAEKSTLDIPLKDIDGKSTSLKSHKGKVMLVVNVASQCGLTKQYKQLQAVHSKYAKKGFTVLGFPCNQFGRQEPGSELEIKKFCSDNYNVTFPLHSKIEVNGKNAHPLYKKIKKESGGSDKISWNFEKFLLDGNGKVIKRFSPRTKPDAKEVTSAIEKALN